MGHEWKAEKPQRLMACRDGSAIPIAPNCYDALDCSLTVFVMIMGVVVYGLILLDQHIELWLHKYS